MGISNYKQNRKREIKDKPSKYYSVKTEIDGIVFDSKKEANRYGELKLLERAGEISNLRLQVPYILFPKNEYGREIKYLADFVYIENGKEIVEDTKGKKTRIYNLKKRIMAEKYGILIKES